MEAFGLSLFIRRELEFVELGDAIDHFSNRDAEFFAHLAFAAAGVFEHVVH